MKCPSCQGEVPNLAIKCTHCGNPLKKQAPPPAPPPRPKREPKPEDPMKALAREALEQQKSKKGPAKPVAEAKAAPKKGPAAVKKPAAGNGGPQGEGQPGEGEAGEVEELVPFEPPDKRKELIRNAVIGAVVLVVAIGLSQTPPAQKYLTSWSAGTAARDLELEVVEGEFLGTGMGQLRVPPGYTDVEGLPAGHRGLHYDFEMSLPLKGTRRVAFDLIGRRVRYEDALAAAKGIDGDARELEVTYGQRNYRVIRYKVPPEEAGKRPRTIRFYQSKKDTDQPFTVEFRYVESGKNRVLMDKLIERIMATLAE